MKQLRDVSLIVYAVVLLEAEQALQQVVVVVEFLKPFKKEVLANLPLLLRHELLCHRRHLLRHFLLHFFVCLTVAAATAELHVLVVVVILLLFFVRHELGSGADFFQIVGLTIKDLRPRPFFLECNTH